MNDSLPKPPEADFRQFQSRAVSVLSKLLKRSQRRLKERQQILIECEAWSEVFHKGQLLQSNLFQINKGMKNITVSDWDQNDKEIVIVLDPLLNPSGQVANYFKRSRKLRAGIVHAKRQLKLAEQEVEERSLQLQNVENLASLSELQSLCQLYGIDWQKPAGPKTVKEKVPAKPYHCFTTEEGFQIWVGKSAKDNDKLTFHCANGSDLWLHARDYPGSHVVIRCEKGAEPNEATLKDAAELALRFSKAKDQCSCEVSLSQVKWLKRIKSAPGKVMLSKHKVMRISLDNDRWLRLKANKN